MTGKVNLGASVRARLLNHSKSTNIDFGLLRTRFAMERLLYRLSISPHRDQFLLKGALLFDVRFDEPHRPTRDADFLGFESADPQRLAALFQAICAFEERTACSYTQPQSTRRRSAGTRTMQASGSR